MSGSGHRAERYDYRNSSSNNLNSNSSRSNNLPPTSSSSQIHLPSINKLPPIAHIDAGAGAGPPPPQQHFQHQYVHQQPLIYGHPPPPQPPAPAPPLPPFPPQPLPLAQPHLLPTMAHIPQGPMPVAGGAYYPPGQQPLPPPPPHGMGVPGDPNAPHRYPLPQDSRLMQGGRHKKEIKRRTKTGCLTCRKRRIKCDEGQPTCRNCMKSKRECLGYDPVFKVQPGPTNIQPAPNTPSQIPPLQHSVTPYPAAHSTYAPVSNHPHPSAMPSGASSSSAISDHQRMDYSTAIDPALEGPPLPGSLYDTFGSTFEPGKPTTIEELLNVGQGMAPPQIPQEPSIAHEKRDEIRQVFLSIYGPGMDKFFETKWFTLRGVDHLLNDQRLCEKFLVLMSRFGYTATTNYQENLITQSLETHVIWESLLLCRQVSASVASTNDSNSHDEIAAGVHDIAKRLKAFECLLTNQQADTDLPSKMDESIDLGRITGLNAQLTTRERSFWKQIAIFASLKEEDEETVKSEPNLDPAMTGGASGPGDGDKIDACLKDMRSFLDSRENRDILYSIAIARHVGQRLASKAAKEGAKPEPPPPVNNHEDDPRTKLHVARSFIQGESSGKGTTQVAQRVCGMAIRSWGAR